MQSHSRAHEDQLPTALPKPKGIAQLRMRERGFNFLNIENCRYCTLINKTGKIICHITNLEHNCRNKVSCRSSNLSYAITCKRCGILYVGQTLVRLKYRFVQHLWDIYLGDQDKSVGCHFFQQDHNGH